MLDLEPMSTGLRRISQGGVWFLSPVEGTDRAAARTSDSDGPGAFLSSGFSGRRRDRRALGAGAGPVVDGRVYGIRRGSGRRRTGSRPPAGSEPTGTRGHGDVLESRPKRPPQADRVFCARRRCTRGSSWFGHQTWLGLWTALRGSERVDYFTDPSHGLADRRGVGDPCESTAAIASWVGREGRRVGPQPTRAWTSFSITRNDLGQHAHSGRSSPSEDRVSIFGCRRRWARRVEALGRAGGAAAGRGTWRTPAAVESDRRVRPVDAHRGLVGRDACPRRATRVRLDDDDRWTAWTTGDADARLRRHSRPDRVP